jgi:hypothetical protein
VGLTLKEAKAFLAGRREGSGIDEIAAQIKKNIGTLGG